MPTSRLGVLTMSALTLAIAAAAGCGGGVESSPGTGGSGGAGTTTSSGTTTTTTTVTSTTSSSSSTTSSSSSSGTGGSMPVCTPVAGTVMAVDALFLGDTDPDGTQNASAWAQYGFNLDGNVSTAASADHCQPYTGATKADVYPDGNDGIDNSFGKNVLPLFKMFLSTPSATVTQNIADGSFTLMIDFEGLMAGADQSPLSAKLYGGADLGMPPKFDGTDCWPVRPELLNDPLDIASSKVVFANGSLATNIWQSGTLPTITLTFPTPVGDLSLTIHNAQMSLEMAADHKSGLNGQIGGVLDREELVSEVKKLIYGVNPLFCGLFDPDQIRRAADIMNDGTQDPTKVCNGISIGIGFTMKELTLGGVAPPGTPGNTMACP